MTESYVPLSQMLMVVQQYIMMTKGVHVSIVPPRDDRELQLLGLAYDIASDRMSMRFTYNFS